MNFSSFKTLKLCKTLSTYLEKFLRVDTMKEVLSDTVHLKESAEIAYGS